MEVLVLVQGDEGNPVGELLPHLGHRARLRRPSLLLRSTAISTALVKVQAVAVARFAYKQASTYHHKP